MNNKMDIQWLGVNEIIPYAKNPRLITEEAISKVAASIKEFGFQQPIVVDKEKVIIAGHTRLQAAIKLGLKRVPVVVANLSAEKAKAYRLADNRTGEFSKWDFDLLADELKELGLLNLDFDLNELGFELKDEHPDTEEGEDDDFDAEGTANGIVEPITKPGDTWLLGEHRLLCGDSTDVDDIKKLVDGAEIDCVVTDPPYNVNYEGKTKDKLKIKNDKMGSSDFNKFLTDAFKSMYEVMKPGAAFYIWYASREHINFESALSNAQLKVRQQLIWYKNNINIGRADYQWKHEPCLYGWKDGEKHYFTPRRDLVSVAEIAKDLFEEGSCDFSKMTKAELIKILEGLKHDDIPSSVFKEKKPLRNDVHPTMKPVPLIARQVRNSCPPGGGSTRYIWGLWNNINCLRTACTQVLYDGVRSGLLRCYKAKVGALDRAKSRALKKVV